MNFLCFIHLVGMTINRPLDRRVVNLCSSLTLISVSFLSLFNYLSFYRLEYLYYTLGILEAWELMVIYSFKCQYLTFIRISSYLYFMKSNPLTCLNFDLLFRLYCSLNFRYLGGVRARSIVLELNHHCLKLW